jgi:integrase/recombinase XerD
MTEQDVMRVLVACRSWREKAVCYCGYYAGMRASEIANLTFADLRPGPPGAASAFLNVRGKGDKVRVVLVPLMVWNLLHDGPFGDAGKPTEPVIQTQLSRADRSADPATIWRIAKAVLTRAGLPQASVHWLRHAHATHALQHGAPLNVVMKTLGHENINTTMAYIHMSPSDSSAMYLPV